MVYELLYPLPVICSTYRCMLPFRNDCSQYVDISLLVKKTIIPHAWWIGESYCQRDATRSIGCLPSLIIYTLTKTTVFLNRS